jgi:hypothetical protein
MGIIPTLAQTDDGESLAFRFHAYQSAALPFASFDALRRISNVAGNGHQYYPMLVGVEICCLGYPHAMVCSAAALIFPEGEFTTMIPCEVALCTSTLST